MPAPTIITYEVFLANAQPDDVRALALLADGSVIKTMNAAEADTYEAIGVRLYNAGVVSRFRRSIETISGETWHVFDGRVVPQALVYVADAARSFIQSQQAPDPAP